MSGEFGSVEQGPPIEVFALNKSYLDDSFEKKVNLGVGAYRTDEGKPWVLPVVKKAKIEVCQDDCLNHEYLPVLGLESFTSAASALLLGDDSSVIKEKKSISVQCLSGTGALRIGAEFLAKILNKKVFYYSNPTWENHHKLFLYSGFDTPMVYTYWDESKRAINFDGMIKDLENAPEGSVIILHACAHNPTGCDPTQEQWIRIADVMESKKLFPFFDSAYQGFASGDPNKDAWAVRYFVSRGFEIFCAQSFAKNFGLYCERIGNLTIVVKDESKKAAIVSQISLLIRGMYSNPPAFGARIVSRVLNDPSLKQQWMDNIVEMSSRIIKMRKLLHEALVNLKTPGTWNHIIQQIGMFSYTGLNEQQVKLLTDEFHIYLLKSGRISMCGLNETNVQYVAEAIHKAVTTVK